MELDQTKNLCIAKETINKIKRQPMECESILTGTSDKELISTIYKELIKLNTKKKKKETIQLKLNFFGYISSFFLEESD